jgi:hypothetical protein
MGSTFDLRQDVFPPNWVAISCAKFLDILKAQYDTTASPSDSMASSLDSTTSSSHAASNDLFRDPKLVGEAPASQAESFTVEDEL